MIKIPFTNEEEKVNIINEQTFEMGLNLVEEANLLDGNYLIFVSEEELNKLREPSPIEKLQQENILLKAQNQALSDRTDFHEDVLSEIILTMYS
jgi:hypothetical protein